ncbi:ATP-dependent helicase [Corynebacterium sp. 320]|uniref:ATP-dependent DNA helicase n=1 Tax=Corynebacterium TaxID=1716 RepID=UPI00125CAFC9|nr:MULTISPECIES: ATP-dependent DNA helicase [Corynebacterium]KAB1504149.1 ATP-dependent helicase [Corynebacterium sp. 320]KAB1552751.1 ATP-dependent helicase [Corynebacterium sp. 321]KAB1554031.1 ATP-dependent helicase [Corynebacterium sp. 319]KAB3528285.1 ATP-dependent helicase [Corynebacterium sp. 250]KAB3540226.1 ATP-dependent helicase [Corynebacterium sp. 366]
MTDGQQRNRTDGPPQLQLEEPTREAVEHEYAGLPLALVTNDPSLQWETPAVVLGGPGTGKSSLLVDIAVQHVRDGGKAEEIMFVAPSKEAAAALREAIFQRVVDQEAYATTGALVRSVHSWAFAVLRAIRIAEGKAAPRLITGAEHDIHVRTLLRGSVEDGAVSQWPEYVRPALSMVGFARNLRDLLLRAAERGVGSAELKDLGEQHGVPMWSGAGAFLEQYEAVQRLAGNDNLNASELLHQVLAAMDTPTGRRIHEDLRHHVRLVLVDDAHNLDPASAQFIESFAAPGMRTIIAGDPDQCVFHFRGADEAFLNQQVARSTTVVELSRSFRITSDVAEAVNALRDHLPTQRARVELRGRDATDPGVQVLASSTETAQRLHVTNTVRRAHTERGVEWKDIAVIVRATSDIAPLRRTLMSYGVPVKIDSTSMVLAQQPLVTMLLLAMESTVRTLTPGETQTLVESAVGGADPVMVRRVQRNIHAAMRAHGRTADNAWLYLSELLQDPRAERNAWMMEFIGPREHDIIERISAVMMAGAESRRAGDSVEMTLWKIWQATELSTRLQWRALRGGTGGAQADEDLDAVMNLFDMAGDFVERNPQASVATFVEEVRAQELPTAGRDRRGAEGNALEILPAHAAAGREWEEVVIAGVQEDHWPAGPTVGGLFYQQELVDLKDHGVDPRQPHSRIAEAVQEERRLFLLALSRARSRTTITTIKSAHDAPQVPSRFLVEIGVLNHDDVDGDEPLQVGETVSTDVPRILALDPLIAELRDAVGDESRDLAERRAAARNLQRLADAGVDGADAAQWWGVRPPSTTERIVDQGPDGPEITLSPSRLERIDGCELSAFLSAHGAVAPTTMHMRIGNIIHAIAEHIAGGLSLEDAQLTMRTMLPQVIDGPQWMKDRYVEEWMEGIERLHKWINSVCAEAERVETELSLRTHVGHTSSGISVHLVGRADLVTHTSESTVKVYDYKTASSLPSVKDAEVSKQLMAYQFILSSNSVLTPAGAALVFPFDDSSKSMTVRNQAEKTPEQLQEFSNDLLNLAEHSAGPSYSAQVGPACSNCDFATLCPAQSEGKMVI